MNRNEVFSISDLITLLSEANDFEGLRSKMDERKLLTQLNSKIRYNIQGSINSYDKKVSILL